jgi:hypothetical protein
MTDDPRRSQQQLSEAHEAHRLKMAALESFEVRIVGGFDVLKEALTASGHDFTITSRTAKPWPTHG